MTATAELDISAQLLAGVGQVADRLGSLIPLLERRQREDERLRRAVTDIPILPVQFPIAANVITNPAECAAKLAPRTGYAWLVQRLSVYIPGANDQIGVYTEAVQPQNFKQLFTATAPTWHPGSTGLILHEGDFLLLGAVSAALTATSVTLSGQAIQVEEPLLAEYLL